jgi:hypothetical protein
LPLSSSTSGRRSGGITGTTSITSHPGRSRVADLLDELEALGVVLDLLLALGLAEVLADLLGLGVEVGALDQLADRVGAHRRLERVAVLLDGLAVLVLGQDLLELELGVARVVTT